jgi:hypothetical protein
VSIACGIFYFIASVVMFASFIYLPVVLLALLFDKM